MSGIGELRTPNTRTGDPKKVTEWSVTLPGGQKAVFDICLRFTEDGGVFSATSKTPEFRKTEIFDADINMLRDKLQDHVRDVISTDLADGWAPAHVVETRVGDKHNLRGREGADISLTVRPVEIRPSEPVGNRGETRTRQDWRQEIVIQRGHEDDFSGIRPKSGNLTDPDVQDYLRSPFRDEIDRRVSRIVVPGKGNDVAALVAALERFGVLLAERMSWQATSRDGLLRPEDLPAMMAEAISPEILPLFES